jgi:hypothetical protein
MEETDAEETLVGTDAEFKQILGLFDVPAFARRGAEVEHTLTRLDERCRRERGAMLDMVRLRLRQWAAISSSPETAMEIFTRPIDDLWPLAEATPPSWADRPAPRRRLRAVAGDLIASIQRFNRRWDQFLDAINFDHINGLVDRYNRHYLLEKECSMGSARLASRFFVPKARVERADILVKFPKMPVPERRR